MGKVYMDWIWGKNDFVRGQSTNYTSITQLLSNGIMIDHSVLICNILAQRLKKNISSPANSVNIKFSEKN